MSTQIGKTGLVVSSPSSSGGGGFPLSNAVPLPDAPVGLPGVANAASREDHVHPAEAAAGDLPYSAAVGNQMVVGETLRFGAGTILFPAGPVNDDVCAAQSVNGAAASIVFDPNSAGRQVRFATTGVATWSLHVTGYPYFRFRYEAVTNAWNLESDATPGLLGDAVVTNTLLVGDPLQGLVRKAINLNALLGRFAGGIEGLSTGFYSFFKSDGVGQPQWQQSFAAVASLISFNLGAGPAIDAVDNASVLQLGLASLPNILSCVNGSGVAIPTPGAAVYVSADTVLSRASVSMSLASAAATAKFIAVTVHQVGPVLPGVSSNFITAGIAQIPAAQQQGVWLAGEQIFVSSTVAGKLTNVKPVAVGTFVVPVGTVFNTPAGGTAWVLLRPGETEENV